MRKRIAADLFCGGGGTSSGAHASGGVRIVFALNHWDVAVKTHSANFPDAHHVNSRLDMTSPSECPPIDLLFASPECTHHSNARGGKPMDDQRRAGAWDVLKWVEFHRPSDLVVENVREFMGWGPLNNAGRPLNGKRGQFFDAWLMAIRAAGYQVDHRLLNAADFSAATSRTRLFVLARKGNRQPVWPEPSHRESPGGEFPGMSLPGWRSAAEVIDWTLPLPSIFARKRPLADKTLQRIEIGLRKFVGPFVVKLRGTGTANGINEPLGTVVPFLCEYYGNGGSESLTTPLNTITTKDRNCLIVARMGDGWPEPKNLTAAQISLFSFLTCLRCW